MSVKKCLPQEGLKLIACVTMLLDHIGAVLTGNLLLRLIGRISFPIFCFLLVQGIRHTHNPKKYLFRLGIFAALSELPYDLMCYGKFTMAGQSVMLTLLLGAVMLLLFDRYQKPVFRVVCLLALGVLAHILRCDYGYRGILLIALFYLTDRPLVQLVGMVFISLISSGAVQIFGVLIPVQLFGIFALIPICLYTGQKRIYHPLVQWLFYIFYPAHMLVLFVMKICT